MIFWYLQATHILQPTIKRTQIPLYTAASTKE